MAEKPNLPTITKTITNKTELTDADRATIYKNLKTYLLKSYTLEEIRLKLIDIGYNLSKDVIIDLITEIRMEQFDKEELKKLIIERLEKRKFAEREALIIYNTTVKEGDTKAQIQALKLLIEAQDKTDEFLTRFNIMPAVPQRTVLESDQKIDTKALIELLIKEQTQTQTTQPQDQ
jgi:endo-1,4-beta-mannosidase